MGTFRLFGCFWSELGCFDPGRGVYCEDVGVGRLCGRSPTPWLDCANATHGLKKETARDDVARPIWKCDGLGAGEGNGHFKARCFPCSR